MPVGDARGKMEVVDVGLVEGKIAVTEVIRRGGWLEPREGFKLKTISTGSLSAKASA